MDCRSSGERREAAPRRPVIVAPHAGHSAEAIDGNTQVGDQLEKRSRHFPSDSPRSRMVISGLFSQSCTPRENAEADYAQALEFLRRELGSTMIAIIGAYSASPERAYPRRHSLVQAAVALEH